MGVGELLASSLRGTAVSLMNTRRPYFLKSVYLLNQFRALQLRCIELGNELEGDLIMILKQIEDVLKQASGKDVCIATNEEVDKAFRDADEVIKKYLASHLSNLQADDFETVSVADSEATKHLQKVSKHNQKKLAILRSLNTIKFNMCWWSDTVRTEKNWNMVLAEFRIEKGATLDVCLLRILDCQRPSQSEKFTLTQNPQLYGGFAYKQRQFDSIAQTQIGRDDIHIEDNQSKSVIYPLHLWWSVEEVVDKAAAQTLHLLVDPAESVGGKAQYTNHWRLEDNYLVRRRALSGTLVLEPSLDPIALTTNSPGTSVSQQSLPRSGGSATLVQSAGASTNSLANSNKNRTPSRPRRNFEHTSNAYSGMEMQTVEAESQEQGGLRGWMKKKLGKYI